MPHIKDYTGKRAHMIGIGGSSMSGLAGMLVKLGVRVTGSDSARSYMTDALEKFAGENERELGRIEVSRRGERFCLAVPPQGAQWVHEHTNPNGFLADFIRTIGRHGCTMEELLAQFHKHSDHVRVEELHNGEFDWLIEFEDGEPDEYRYCIADEGGHLTYHRFTREDYEAFGF